MSSFPEIHIWGDSLGRGITFSPDKNKYVISPDRCDAALSRGLPARAVQQRPAAQLLQHGQGFLRAHRRQAQADILP